MIRLQEIRLGFADKTVLDGVDWLVPEGARVGLVGDNGSGKTTLLRILVGQVQPDSGTVELPRRAAVGYLPQDLEELEPLPLGLYLKRKTGLQETEEEVGRLEAEIAATPHDAPHHASLLRRYEAARETFRHRDGFAFEATARRVLKGLGFSASDWEKNCRDFSGGWKMRAALAAILLARPDVMLLDEPTNHLDTESMEWLESFLRDYRGTLVAVSHDHMFLDKMTRQTVEINRGKLELYKGGYSFYLREKEARLERLRKERELQKAEIKRQMIFIERFRYKASKAAQVQSRLKLLEKFAVLPEEEKKRRAAIRFPEGPRSGREVIVAENLGHAYADRPVLTGLTFTVQRGEKVALVGVNGAGKSTLSRLVSGVEAPRQGTIRRGEGVKLACFSQESAGNLDYGRTVFEEILSAGGRLDDQERRNLLGAFLFPFESLGKRVGVLSGGEKSRLALLRLLLQESNCLVLDEPTNHLDIRTKEIFQQALLAYGGTLVIVSHDRHFLDELVTRVFEIRETRLHDYPGNYSDFIRRREAELASAPSAPPSEAGPSNAQPAPPGRRSKEQRRLEAEERNRRLAERRRLKRELDALEAEIALLEESRTRLETSLSDPAFLADSIRIKPAMVELKGCSRDLAASLERWETLMAELEQLPEPG